MIPAALKLEAEVFKIADTSESSRQLWNSQYGGMMYDEKNLLQLEIEKKFLKAFISDLSLDKQILTEVLSKKL